MAHEIVIPRLGWSMEEGTFLGWLKRDGEFVRRGEPLFELEGEKAMQAIEAVDEGILRISPNDAPIGSVLKVGAVIGYLDAQGESATARSGESPVQPNTLQPKTLQPKTLQPETAIPCVAAPSVRRLARAVGVSLSDLQGTGRGGRILSADVYGAKSSSLPAVATENVHVPPVTSEHQFPTYEKKVIASPRAKRIARELGIDWTTLSGTGSGGRVRESDVRAAIAQRPISTASPSTTSQLRIPHTSRRRVIAQRMVTSRQQTVSVTLTTRADASNLVNLRKQFKARDNLATVPSYQDIITKLVGETLKRHRLLTGRWEEDGIVLAAETELHLGIAVDTEDGLLVPVIRDVGGISLMSLAEKSRQLIERARSGRLVAADMQGGVFTVTNLGAYGIDAFTPVINTPESAILGLGAIRSQPVELNGGQYAERHLLTLSLTFDHRIIDGAPAARFLQSLVLAIANPSAFLL